MELDVQNIKTWDNLHLHIDIHDLKHVLISGLSGIGKTTLLDCIYFAITGGYLTNKWSLRHKRKQGQVKLYLQTQNLNITRTLNPKSISVNKDDEILTGDAAQEYISIKFDQGLFKYIGYLRQKSTYSYFISMPPKERMIFIENVVFTDIDMDATKMIIKESIDKAKTEYTLLDIQLGKLESRNIKPRIKQADIESINNYINYLSIKKQSLLDTVKNVDVLESRLQELQITQYEYSTELNELDMNKTKIETFCKTFEPKLQLYTTKTKEYEETDAFYRKYQDLYKMQNLNINELKKRLLNLDEINEKIIFQEGMIKLYQDYLNVKKRIKSLNFDSDKLTRLKTQYETTYIIYNNCPNCDILLGANLNGIHLVSGNEKTLTADQINTLKQEITDLENKQHHYKILKEILSDIESKLHYPIWTSEEMNNQLLIKREQEEFHREYNQLVQLRKIEHSSSYPRISEQEYKVMKSDLELYNQYIAEKGYIQDQINKIQLKLNLIDEKISIVTHELEESTHVLDQLNTITIDLEKQQISLIEKKETLEYQSIYYQYMEKKHLWEDYTKFQKYFNETRSNVIMYTLESINALIKKYIDGFFENFNLSIYFFVNDKDCIDIHIEYENATPADLSILSGGEYDRVVLAIVLAFGEFYKLPLLLLDEITSSLDLHTLQYVINHVHKCYPDNQTVIYVGHQMISGNFDYHIDLDLIK